MFAVSDPSLSTIVVLKFRVPGNSIPDVRWGRAPGSQFFEILHFEQIWLAQGDMLLVHKKRIFFYSLHMR